VGLPRYLSNPNSSAVRIIEYEKYKALSVKEVQDVLRVQHIVITHFPLETVGPTHGPVAFDEAGLRHLRNLESPIKFHGKC
jgi:hypothetical protein